MSKAPKGQNYFMFGCATTKKRIRKIVNDRLEDLKIEQQKEPAVTAPTADAGVVQPKPVDVSILGQVTGEHAKGGAYIVGQ